MSASDDSGIERAIEMLEIAAAYIKKYAPDNIVRYDGANCDGYCIGNDCEIAAEWLKIRKG